MNRVRGVFSMSSWTSRVISYKKRFYLRKDNKDFENIKNSIQQIRVGDWTKYGEDRLLRFLKYANQNCPYYCELFKTNGIDISDLRDFRKIPLLVKSAIRENFEEIVSSNLKYIDFYPMNTGGSTGEPLDFLVSSHAGKIDGLHQEFVFTESLNYESGDLIVAFDGSTVPDSLLSKNVYWIETSDSDLPYGRISFSSLYLNESTIRYYVEHLARIQPKIIRGYPSFIGEISNFILENNIKFDFNIKGVQLTAENHHADQILTIENAFKTKVFLQYGHSEVCVFGFNVDDSFEYICSPFYGYTEVLNESGRQVDVGDIGEIVVTGFNNRAMPFIRYRTGDLAVYGGMNRGVTRLEKILGRDQDFIIGASREKVSLTALVFGQHYKSFANIRKWQLQQDDMGEVKLRIVRDHKFSITDEEEIQRKFKKIGNVNTEFVYVDDIYKTQRGKFKFLIQNLRG